mgnify:CR=1 FL=1
MENIVLYSNECPKCKVLKIKLDQKDVSYKETENFEELSEKGFKSLPVLKINEEFMDFAKAYKWVQELK